MTKSTPASSAALDTFCRVHWLRLHAVACQRGCTPLDAEDSVQDLFLNLARRGLLDDLFLRPEEAQIAYLSMRLRCLIQNRWRDAHRLRRGGQTALLSLDDVPDVPCHEASATNHDRAWLAGCITAAMSRLCQQTRAQTWQQISPVLLEDLDTPQSAAQRVAVHRARRKLRGLVREEMNGSFKDWSAGLITPSNSSTTLK